MKVGSFLTGVASGLQMFPQIQEMKWKKAERKAIEKEKEDWKEAISVFQGNLDEYSANRNLSYGEQMDILSASSALGHEYMNIMQDWISDVNQGNREGAKQKAEILAAYRDFTLNTGFPVEGVETILSKDTMKYIQQGNILKETGGKTGEVMGRETWKERGFGKLPVTTEAPKLTDTQVKLAEIDKLTFLTEKRRDQMKVDMLSKSDSATAEKVKAIRAAGGTNEQIIKALGGDISEPTPEGEAKRTDIAYWTKRFDDVTNEDEWNTTMRDLEMTDTTWKPKGTYKDKLISEVKEMADTIKRELLTPDNKFINDKAKEQYLGWQRLYEQKIREIMQKYPDIDINRFAKYLSIEEIKPVGFWKGLITGGGIAKGDYSVIDIKGW